MGGMGYACVAQADWERTACGRPLDMLSRGPISAAICDLSILWPRAARDALPDLVSLLLCEKHTGQKETMIKHWDQILRSATLKYDWSREQKYTRANLQCLMKGSDG